MNRDDKMMQLVAPEKEPITPFVRIVRSLYDDCGISTILVIGGVGDYFDVADNVVVMDCYKCLDVTERAKQIVANSKTSSSIPHVSSESVAFQAIRRRSIVGKSFSPNGKVKVRSQSTISYGETELDLLGLEQLVVKSQTAAISNALQCLPGLANEKQSLRETLQAIATHIDEDGLDVLTPGQYHGGMSRPRLFEIAGAINRLRRSQSIVQIS
jgi:predicted ABC-class ATPase